MWCAESWRDYELLDCSDGERLERWGRYYLVRPDPQVIWKNRKRHAKWKSADAVYRREGGGGSWARNTLPEGWNIGWGELEFGVKLMGFKHTGLFPEQAVNWEWFMPIIENAVKADPQRQPNILNLFAYTGGATLAAAKAGAKVCHVDAAKGMVQRAKDNAALSGLSDKPIRYIVDDCVKFVEREIRRGVKYDGVIMDPPSYGRGPGGEMWKLEENIDSLITLTSKLLSDKPLFFLVNSYTTGLSGSSMGYMLRCALEEKYGGRTVSDELGLKVTRTGGILPCGASARWQK